MNIKAWKWYEYYGFCRDEGRGRLSKRRSSENVDDVNVCSPRESARTLQNRAISVNLSVQQEAARVRNVGG